MPCSSPSSDVQRNDLEHAELCGHLNVPSPGKVAPYPRHLPALISPHPRQPPLTPWIYLFWTSHVNGLVCYVASGAWPLSLSTVFLSSSWPQHASYFISLSLCQTAFLHGDSPRVICSWTLGHSSGFHLLAIMNNAAVNIRVRFCVDVFLFPLGVHLEAQSPGH